MKAVKVFRGLLRKNPIIKIYCRNRKLKKYVFDFMLPEKLIVACLNDEKEKKRIIVEWEKFHQERAQKLDKDINHLIKNAAIEDTEELRLEMKFYFYSYGYSPNEYISYGLKELPLREVRSYISDRESVIYGYRLNDYSDRIIFTDKMNTYQMFSDYYKRKAISVKCVNDKAEYIKFVKKYPIFVKKNVVESCGRSVELIDLHNHSLEIFFDELVSTDRRYILEERVIQSKSIAVLNESSVNTVRCFTLKTKNDILIPWTFMKVGRRGSFVDNGGAGGLLVGIDTKIGVCNTEGVDEYGRRYSKHPDTGVVFQGFELPDWEKMICMCKEMAQKVPSIPWIGWDMAHTQHGWVVIEGNCLSEVIGPQATSQSGIRKEFEEYIKRM